MSTQDHVNKLKARVFHIESMRIFPEDSVVFFMNMPVEAWKIAIREGKVPHTTEVIARLHQSLYDDERALAKALESVLKEMKAGG